MTPVYRQGVKQDVLPITKLTHLQELIDAAVIGFACAFIDFSEKERREMGWAWVHDLPTRVAELKSKLLAAPDGPELHDKWTKHFQDHTNYEVDLNSNMVLLLKFPDCDAINIEVG